MEAWVCDNCKAILSTNPGNDAQKTKWTVITHWCGDKHFCSDNCIVEFYSKSITSKMKQEVIERLKK